MVADAADVAATESDVLDDTIDYGTVLDRVETVTEKEAFQLFERDSADEISMTHRAFLGLGSNIGDRAARLREAVAAIPDVVATVPASRARRPGALQERFGDPGSRNSSHEHYMSALCLQHQQ